MSPRIRSVSLLGLVLFMLAATSAQAAFPGQNGKLVFQRGGTDPEIYAVQPDGSGLTQLTNKPGFDGQPAWSPDGSRIVFWGEGAGGTSDIFVMNANGTGLTNVTNSATQGEAEPAWSHDGTKILFTGSSNDVDIFVMNANGTGAVQLTTDPAFDAQAAWSPDGTRIAYVTNPDYPMGDFDIVTMNPDGTGKVVIAGGASDDGHPDWSPDGNRIAFARDATPFANEYDVWVMNATGSGQTQLTSTPGIDFGPAFSPDGTKIALGGGNFPSDLFTINANGTGRANVTNDRENDGFPDWQPRPSSPAQYVRPKAATPYKVPLVVAYDECTAPNRQHGPPLEDGACSPPVPASTAVTVGTLDANGADANSEGSLRLNVQVGPQPDDNDVLLQGFVSDVRCRTGTTACGNPNDAGGADYTGELLGQFVVRMTDRLNTVPGGGGGQQDGATVVDIPFVFPFTCANTASAAEGGLCTVGSTSFDAVVPASIKDGKRAVWELGQAQITDGGPDGQTETTPNTEFMKQGLFVP